MLISGPRFHLCRIRFAGTSRAHACAFAPAPSLIRSGPRFGGALDQAAQDFKWALRNSMKAKEFVNYMRGQRKLIMGIGHKIKSTTNPDLRVTIIKNYAKEHFPACIRLTQGLSFLPSFR